MTTPLKETVGRYGIWSVGLRSEDPDRRGELAEAAAELEELGYGAVWLGGNSSAANAAPLIEATSKLTVGTSIQSIWQHEPDAAATAFADLESAHPGRFLLGLGVSHAKRVEQYARPYSALVGHLDGLDAAGVPADRRLLAALGPKSLRLARDRAAGSIPYLVTPEHTAHAREILGETPLLAPELGVVPETDPTAPAPWPASSSSSTSPCRTTPTTSCGTASPRTICWTAGATAWSTPCSPGATTRRSARRSTRSSKRALTTSPSRS
jgi:probable F420-dependent oxidoreductase